MCLVFFSSAQQYHFVYIQTDNKQPFYIRTNNIIYSSSPSGYVVVPKLIGAYQQFTVGFPKNEWPSQTMSIDLGDKDQGYLLKNFSGKGWSLFNLQTMELVSKSSQPAPKPAQSNDIKTDEFSNVLADVVNTPSLKEEEPKQIKASTPVSQMGDNSEKLNADQNTSIKKISSRVAADGQVMVYLDKQDTITDTIKITIPAAPAETPPKAAHAQKEGNPAPAEVNPPTVAAKKATEEANPPTVEAKQSTEEAKPPISEVKPAIVETKPTTVEVKQAAVPAESVAEERKPDNKAAAEPKPKENAQNPTFLSMELPNPNLSGDRGKDSKPPTNANMEETAAGSPVVGTKPIMINSDCKQIATQEDFMKARKKMVAKDNEDQMVDEAKKLFKQKCYSTEQIKNLGVLLFTDEGKYKLFEAAYPFVFDSQNFKQLESQLTEQYSIVRFRALIRK
jgi:hypothetical protein